VGLALQERPIELQDNAKTFEHLKSIWQILRNTPGFEPMKLVPVLSKLITNPETHRMGQQVAEGLAQKAIARLIRNVVLEWD
jgi:hypothetical protein